MGLAEFPRKPKTLRKWFQLCNELLLRGAAYCISAALGLDSVNVALGAVLKHGK